MNKSFVKKFVSKVFDEMKETDKKIIKQQQEVEKLLMESREVIKQGVRFLQVKNRKSVTKEFA